MKRRAQLSTFLLAAGLAGCAVPTDPVPENPIETDLTDPLEVVAAYERALNERQLDAYLALLEKPGQSAGFRFYLIDSDAVEVPWLVPPLHDYNVEARTIENMMNPNFVGDAPAVTAIEAKFEVLNPHSASIETGTEIAATIRISASSGQSWTTDTRLGIRLAQDANGFLRLRSMVELDLFGVDPTWWAIKRPYLPPE